MGMARHSAAAVSLSGGRVLVLGGEDELGNALSCSEIFDANDNTWSAGPDMGGPRFCAAAISLPHNKALVIGGHDGANSLASTLICAWTRTHLRIHRSRPGCLPASPASPPRWEMRWVLGRFGLRCGGLPSPEDRYCGLTAGCAHG